MVLIFVSGRPNRYGFQRNAPDIPTYDDDRRFAGDQFPSSGQSELRQPFIAAVVQRGVEADYSDWFDLNGPLSFFLFPPLNLRINVERLLAVMRVTVRNLTRSAPLYAAGMQLPVWKFKLQNKSTSSKRLTKP